MEEGCIVAILPVTVWLEPWQVLWGAYAAKQRTDLNAGRVKNKPDYQNPGVLQTDIEANTASCLCELATSLYTNQSWNGPYWHPKHHKQASKAPDVGRDIEVRRTRNVGSGIPVFEHEAQQNRRLVQAYIAPDVLQRVLDADPDYPGIEILLTGTILASRAWALGYQKYEEKRVCSPQFFTSVVSLAPDLVGNMFEINVK